MFKQNARLVFNNAVLKKKTIPLMTEKGSFHASTQRLYLAARELKSVNGQSAVARLLNQSPQTVKNWEARGISKAGAIEAARIIGCSALWLMQGIGPMTAGAAEQTEAVPTPPPSYWREGKASWPFKTISPDQYNTLSFEQKMHVEQNIRMIIGPIEEKQDQPRKIAAAG